MVINMSIIIFVSAFCALSRSVVGDFNNSASISIPYDDSYYNNAYSSAEGRQLNHDRGYRRIYSRGKLRHVKSGKIKTRMVDSNSVMVPDTEDNMPDWMDNPMDQYNYKYYPKIPSIQSYRQGQNGHYFSTSPYEGYMDDNGANGKEALKAFGFGLTVGLGLLGLVSGLSKFLLIPLAFGTLLSLLLVLAAPVPVITTGKMLLASLPINKKKRMELQETLEEIAKKLPDLKNPPMANVKQ